ncbi:MAG TPA: hypothetical protein VEA61_07340 [Allosphingosinicella sp.]|nr:hypothetical protein [Allosphingosinicella sp.]
MGSIEPIFVQFGAALVALMLLREAVRFFRVRLYAIPMLSAIPIASLALVGLTELPTAAEWGIAAVSVVSVGSATLLRFGRRCPRCGTPLKDKTLSRGDPLGRGAIVSQLAYCPSCTWQKESKSFELDPGASDRKRQEQVSAWRPETLDYIGQVGLKNPSVSRTDFLKWWEIENRHGERPVPDDQAGQNAIMIEYFGARGVRSHRVD